MTATLTHVFDSPEWMLNLYHNELMGSIESGDEGYEELRAAALMIIGIDLAFHWHGEGYGYNFVTAKAYERATSDDEAVNITSSMFYLPDPEEALAVWEKVFSNISIDEIRQTAGLD